MKPRHELLVWFLEHEVRLAPKSEAAVMTPPVSHCRGKEEAAVWAQAPQGMTLAAPPSAEERLVPRIRSEARPNHERDMP